MIDLPKRIEDLEALIRERVAEDIHLDYKRSAAISDAKKAEIAKDVSAFANSDGGIIVYGIEEDQAQHLPVSVDGGVDSSMYGREWLEHVIDSNIHPRVDGIEISVVQIASDRSAYAIRIPKSIRAPHQSADKKFYKRFNFKSQPMEHYEIDDLRNRALVAPGRLSVGIEAHRYLMYFFVANTSNAQFRDISFRLPDTLGPWLEKHQPNFLTRGIKELQPGARMAILWDSYLSLIQQNSPSPKQFDIEFSYKPAVGDLTISDVVHVDLVDYWHTRIEASDVEQLGETIEKSLKELISETKRLADAADRLSTIASPTGLNLSVTALRNLGNLAKGVEGANKLDPTSCELEVFEEVLGVNRRVAFDLYKYFHGHGAGKLDDVPGMTADLARTINEWFRLDEPIG